MKRILILLHECERFRDRHYLIDDLREAWQNWGLQVSYVYGVRDRPEADLLIPHVDLTHTPPEYIEYIRSYPATVNRGLFDISKRRISTHLLHGDEDFRGPVIVKTDNNAGGAPENRVARHRHPVLARLRRRLATIAEHAPGQHLAWRRRAPPNTPSTAAWRRCPPVCSETGRSPWSSSFRRERTTATSCAIICALAITHEASAMSAQNHSSKGHRPRTSWLTKVLRFPSRYSTCAASSAWIMAKSTTQFMRVTSPSWM